MLSLNLSSIIFTVINLLVLVYFVHRFLFKPVRAALKARQTLLIEKRKRPIQRPEI